MEGKGREEVSWKQRMLLIDSEWTGEKDQWNLISTAVFQLIADFPYRFELRSNHSASANQFSGASSLWRRKINCDLRTGLGKETKHRLLKQQFVIRSQSKIQNASSSTREKKLKTLRTFCRCGGSQLLNLFEGIKPNYVPRFPKIKLDNSWAGYSGKWPAVIYHTTPSTEDWNHKEVNGQQRATTEDFLREYKHTDLLKLGSMFKANIYL